jgi:hypothetical protein
MKSLFLALGVSFVFAGCAASPSDVAMKNPPSRADAAATKIKNTFPAACPSCTSLNSGLWSTRPGG